MKKPNRKDFPNNRNGRSRYQNALRKYNASVRKTNRESEKKRKNIGKDPRPKIGDYKNREAFRQAVLKWRKKNVTPKTKTTNSRGRKLKRNDSLKIKKQVDKYVADRKVPIRKITKLKVSDEAKQDLKDQSSDKFGGKLPKQKLKIKPSKEAKQDLKDQASDKFGGKLPNKKKDPLADYRRGKDTKLGKDTSITKSLKKAGFTETRLARLRKKNAEFQSIKKIKDRKERKKKMEAYRSKYG